MKEKLMALFTGLLFGLGLSLAQMIDRDRVLGFLDIAGQWDPTLLFVLLGAVAVTVVAFRFVLARPQPIFAVEFHLPTKKEIDVPLIVGSAIFGVGWGISGYCPGPGITALGLGIWNPVLFMIAFVIGSLTFKGYLQYIASSKSALAKCK
ncbi:MAG: YeeE/YedE family protein [Elainellaceae cyanobacterium]